MHPTPLKISFMKFSGMWRGLIYQAESYVSGQPDARFIRVDECADCVRYWGEQVSAFPQRFHYLPDPYARIIGSGSYIW
jgi:hypothetical protein